MSHEAGEAPGGCERVLLVDDEADLLAVGARTLERLGYTVTATTSSLEALELIEAGPDDFDVVVTDQTMPELSGTQLASCLKRIRKDLPVVLCTGYSSTVDERSAASMGIDAFLMKPIELRRLARTLRALLPPPDPS